MNKLSSLLCLLSLTSLLTARGEVPPPEKLLPADTLATFTVPNFQAASEDWQESSFALLLKEPSLQPFLEHFKSRFQEKVMQPFQEKSGLQWEEFRGLIEGQLTVALIRDDWQGPGAFPALVAVLDSGSQAERLREKLAELRQRSRDAGENLPSIEIRGLEFVELPMPDSPEGAGGGMDLEGIYLGQSDSLLILGTSRKSLEELLARQDGSSLPALDSEPIYQADAAALMRGASGYFWMNVSLLRDILNQYLAGMPQNNSPVPPQQLMEALGFNGLQSVVLTGGLREGDSVGDFYLGVPAAKRKGLFKLLEFSGKDSSIPPSIPGNVLNFSRWRLDLAQAWSTLENMINEVSPQYGFMFQTVVSGFGKDRDPNFDVKTSLIQNLGDDIISMALPPEGDSLEELVSPPQLFLISSPDAEQLLGSLKFAVSGLAGNLGGMKEREVNGRTVHRIPLGPDPEMGLEFTAAAGYLAVGTQASVLDQYLGQAGEADNPLRAKTGLTTAIDQAGGTQTGLLGLENDRENVAILIRAVKENPEFINEFASGLPVPDEDTKHVIQTIAELFDFNRLPDTEQIAKYFFYSIYTGRVDDRGIGVRALTPRPPGIQP